MLHFLVEGRTQGSGIFPENGPFIREHLAGIRYTKGCK